MAQFVENVWLDSVQCCECNVLFAMPAAMKKDLLNSCRTFYCPAGHSQHYTKGQGETDMLRAELERKTRMLEAAEILAMRISNDLTKVSRAHHRMRARVFNGVCPCCNRSFENLRRHMQSEHAELPVHERLKHLRTAFGMTQADLGGELNVSTSLISNFENGVRVKQFYRDKIVTWIEQQVAERESHD